MATVYGNNAPLKIGGAQTWRGQDRTNGFLMRNADGRIPAIQESFSAMNIGGGSALAAEGAVPWGNALWLDQAQLETKPGTVFADKPTKGILVGVVKFDQAWQTGHPVLGWGLQAAFAKGTRIRSGLVGYKQSMQAVGDEANYLALLKGNMTHDVDTVRLVYSDWVAALAAANEGDRLGLFFGNASGFPIIQVVPAGTVPELANATFGGFGEIFENENQTVFFRINETNWFPAAST